MKPTPLSVFCCYAHQDEDLRQKLDKHLQRLVQDGLIQIWSDKRIVPGESWPTKISESLEHADIILPLVSADFMASEYCQKIEMKRALERQALKEAVVIPVILRSVDWQTAAFGNLQALPPGVRAVNEWPNEDQAFLEVAKGIRRAVEGLCGLGQTEAIPLSRNPGQPAQRSFPRWMIPSAGLIAAGLVIAGLAFMRMPHPAQATANEDKKVSATLPAPSNVTTPPAAAPKSAHVSPKQYEVSVVLDQGADTPSFVVDGKRATPVSFSSGIATFKLPVGSHGLSAKYQNPNQTCTAILTTPAEGLVTATCNPD
jgi:hypothetical protein